MKKTFASILAILGFIFFLIAIMSAYYGITSYFERSNNGNGLSFSAVEIYAGLTLIFILIGFLFIRISNRLKKSLPPKK